MNVARTAHETAATAVALAERQALEIADLKRQVSQLPVLLLPVAMTRLRLGWGCPSIVTFLSCGCVV